MKYTYRQNNWDLGCTLGFVLIIVVSLYGWVSNIISLVHALNDPVTGMMLLRAVGIFFVPLGVVLGYF